MCRALFAALAESSDARFAGLWAAEALRIEAWRPRYGTEADDKTIPQELIIPVPAVHFDKGCYRDGDGGSRITWSSTAPSGVLGDDGSAHPSGGRRELFVRVSPARLVELPRWRCIIEAGPDGCGQAVDPGALVRLMAATLPDGSAPATDYARCSDDGGFAESVMASSLVGQDFL